MKNKNLFFFLLTILALIAFSGCKKKSKEIVIVPDAQKNHLQRSRLKGDIQFITTTAYNTSNKDSLTQNNISSIIIQHYSSDGYLIKLITLDKNLDTVNVRNIHYNDTGKELNWVENDYFNKKTLTCKYLYDINGYLSKEEYYSQDTNKYSILYKTDGIGGVIEMIRNYPEYSIRNTFSYNEKGLISKINEYDPNQKLFKYITIEYDNYGDEVNRKVYRSENNIIEYTYTQYDQYGKLLRVIFENRIHALKDIKTYYEHDPKGNWRFEVFTTNKDTLYFRKREITYY